MVVFIYLNENIEVFIWKISADLKLWDLSFLIMRLIKKLPTSLLLAQAHDLTSIFNKLWVIFKNSIRGIMLSEMFPNVELISLLDFFWFFKLYFEKNFWGHRICLLAANCKIVIQYILNCRLYSTSHASFWYRTLAFCRKN